MIFINKGIKQFFINKKIILLNIIKYINLNKILLNFSFNYLLLKSISNGKGFQGVIKKWGFKTKDRSHGCSLSYRTMGSTGQCQDPGKVFKGKKMPGKMGDIIFSTYLKIFLRNKNYFYFSKILPGKKNDFIYGKIL